VRKQAAVIRRGESILFGCVADQCSHDEKATAVAGGLAGGCRRLNQKYRRIGAIDVDSNERGYQYLAQ
jgi:hypothetical protein